MYKARIAIKATSDARAKGDRDRQARALQFALDRYFEKQKAAGMTGTNGGEAKKGYEHEVRPTDI